LILLRGCKGGSQGSAYAYIMKMGIETSNTYPYLEDLRHDGIYPCHYNKSNTVVKIKGYLRIRPKDEKTLRDVVAAMGPVAFAFDGSLESFMYYENGIYDDTSCPR
jgi:Papain family cysteine protease